MAQMAIKDRQPEHWYQERYSSQVITLFITPVIYLYLDRFSGKGPVLREEGAVAAG